jgi:CMP-2-keto-3-deoxyoctulosonic acid synthetase
VFGNDYSVHPSAIGRMVEVSADLDRIQVSCDGRTVADHARSWGNALTITDPAHVHAAARLRHAFQNPPPAPAETAVMQRNLADYDAAFGVEISTGQVLS